MKHKINIEKKIRKEKCELASPTHNSNLVIEISDEELDTPESSTSNSNLIIEISDEELDTPEPSTSKSSLPLDRDYLCNFSKDVSDISIKGKADIIHQKLELCSDYFIKKNEEAKNNTLEVNKLSDKLERSRGQLNHLVNDNYRNIVSNVSEVDLDDTENDTHKCKNNNGVLIANNYIFKKRKNSFENKKEKRKKEDNIEIIETYVPLKCKLPSDLPKEGILKYPNIVVGEQVYGEKYISYPWYKGIVSSIVNYNFMLVKFGNDVKLLSRKNIAEFKLNPVRFPVGCRVIAKYNPPGKSTDYYYSGLIAEPPKILNNFR